MTRWAWILVVSFLASACGGDEAPPLSEYAEQCMATEECEEPLVCANGLCTFQCNGSTPACAEADSSGRSVCMPDGYCYIACMSNQNCPSSLRCVMAGSTQGTCRP